MSANDGNAALDAALEKSAAATPETSTHRWEALVGRRCGHSGRGEPNTPARSGRFLLASQFWPMLPKSRRGLSQLHIGQSTLSGWMDG